MKETWKKIENHDIYMISSLGKIKSLSRKVNWSHHGVSGLSVKKEKILKLYKQKINSYLSYWQVSLTDNQGKAHTHHVHRIVAKAFLENPENKPQVNHLDGNGLNNNVKNLEWVTISENGLHAFNVLNRTPSALGKIGIKSKLSKKVIQKDLDGNTIKVWDAVMDAHRAGFLCSRICQVCKGNQKTHKGFKWEYA